MELRGISQQIWDVAATEQAIAYAKKDTKADGSVFASFHFCDWETMQVRAISEAAYLQIKFGNVGAYVAEALGEILTCRAARLPDGGCAVLRTDSMLELFRPDGRSGAKLFLNYQQAPAYDIVYADGGLWYTVPSRDAVVKLSLQTREMELRVGGQGVFARPLGLTAAGGSLFLACARAKEIKQLQLPGYELGGSIVLGGAPEKYFTVFRREFVWMGEGLFFFF